MIMKKLLCMGPIDFGLVVCVLMLGVAAQAQAQSPVSSAAPSAKAATSQDATLFQVNNKKVSVGEFLNRYKIIQEQTIAPPSQQLFLEDLVRFEVGVQEAVKQGADQWPEFKERMRQEMYKMFVERAIRKQVEKIKVTERELRRYYSQNPELRTSHILIQYPPQGTAEQKSHCHQAGG